MAEHMEVFFDKLVKVWTREVFTVKAGTKEEAISIAKRQREEGGADDYYAIWDSEESLSPNQLLQVGKITEEAYVEGECVSTNEEAKPSKPSEEEIEAARNVLRRAGYAVDNLWCDKDVMHKFDCTPEQALEVMNDALQNDYIMEQIHFAVGEVADAMNLKSKF